VANWLYVVAQRLAVRLRADIQRRRHVERETDLAHYADPLSAARGRELCAALDEELARLPERMRTPLVLCCLEGQTRDEAARSLGWSLGTLKRRLEQGRALLRGRLEKRGVTLPATLAGALVAEGVSQAAIPTALMQTALTTATNGMAGSARVLALAEPICQRAIFLPVQTAALVLAVSLIGDPEVPTLLLQFREQPPDNRTAYALSPNVFLIFQGPELALLYVFDVYKVIAEVG
jgi:hypothetical protein